MGSPVCVRARTGRHGGQPFQGIVRFLLLAVLGVVDDLGLFRKVLHPLLREGGANQVGGQIFQGLLLTGMDSQGRSTR